MPPCAPRYPTVVTARRRRRVHLVNAGSGLGIAVVLTQALRRERPLVARASAPRRSRSARRMSSRVLVWATFPFAMFGPIICLTPPALLRPSWPARAGGSVTADTERGCRASRCAGRGVAR
jgi:hypothetical protein